VTAAYRLAFFDVDSTLVTIEGIDYLARGSKEIAELTDAAMNGRMALDEVYGRRLDVIRPTRSDVEELAAAYQRSLVTGALEAIRELQQAGLQIYLVTAGIEQAILPLAALLAIPRRNVRAVRLSFDTDGRFLDFDRHSVLTRAGGKELTVRDIRSRTKGKAVFIGDGVSDLEARPAVDLFVGFGGVRVRKTVREKADIFIEEPTLDPIVPIIIGGTGR
jgi:phosphoserine phosphatase